MLDFLKSSKTIADQDQQKNVNPKQLVQEVIKDVSQEFTKDTPKKIFTDIFKDLF